MNYVQPSVTILDFLDGDEILKKIELCGRVCYKSEEKIADKSAKDFVRMILANGHESVLEHVNITVKFVTDRAIANEIVRHRIASYSQESTRYCNYGDGVNIVANFSTEYDIQGKIEDFVEATSELYSQLIQDGVEPQFARDVLPLGLLKTELVMTTNLREWRYILRLRTSPNAHPKMRALMKKLHAKLMSIIPIVFDDIPYDFDEGSK